MTNQQKNSFPNLKQTLAHLPSPKLGIASLRGRLIFRGVFLLLMLATVLLALMLLKGEKIRAHQNYQRNLNKTHATVMAQLRHPSGKLALLNPDIFSHSLTPLRPILLPYSALDFSDYDKSLQAMEVAGCAIHYPQGDICVGVGSNPYAGGFIYIVGQVETTDLMSRTRGELDLNNVHRVHLTLDDNGKQVHWVAPFEQVGKAGNRLLKGKLAGFAGQSDVLNMRAKPNREFIGWMWQSRNCNDGFSSNCLHTTYYSLRVPVNSLAKAISQKNKPLVWPPKNLADYKVRVVIKSPLSDETLFDSNAEGASLPYALKNLAEPLLAGEVLTIRNKHQEDNPQLMELVGEQTIQDESPYYQFLQRVIAWMPAIHVPQSNQESLSLAITDTLKHATGHYEVELQGNLASVNRELSLTAARVTWVVVSMLMAILLAWLLVEFSFLNRLSLLTKRAAKVSYNINEQAPSNSDLDLAARIKALNLDDLKSKDEVGILANSLSTLLARVEDDMHRAQVRAQQDKDMWHAVGHEIMSPLQSLMVLHPQDSSPSYRYVNRMQHAIRMLYGHASPSEAVEAVNLDVEQVELDAFLQLIAENAHYAGVNNVVYQALNKAVLAKANAFSLEDSITHILNNAERYRTPDTPIVLSLVEEDSAIEIRITNQGEPIPQEKLAQIFDYGVSDEKAQQETVESRGQGLFIAKSYIAKMGGSIRAENVADGVMLVIRLSAT